MIFPLLPSLASALALGLHAARAPVPLRVWTSPDFPNGGRLRGDQRHLDGRRERRRLRRRVRARGRAAMAQPPGPGLGGRGRHQAAHSRGRLALRVVVRRLRRGRAPRHRGRAARVLRQLLPPAEEPRRRGVRGRGRGLRRREGPAVLDQLGDGVLGRRRLRLRPRPLPARVRGQQRLLRERGTARARRVLPHARAGGTRSASRTTVRRTPRGRCTATSTWTETWTSTATRASTRTGRASPTPTSTCS